MMLILIFWTLQKEKLLKIINKPIFRYHLNEVIFILKNMVLEENWF